MADDVAAPTAYILCGTGLIAVCDGAFRPPPTPPKFAGDTYRIYKTVASVLDVFRIPYGNRLPF